MSFKKLFKLLRIDQWIKNLYIFTAAFFGEKLFDAPVFINLVIGFFAFSFMASCIYIVNDYLDIEKDRLHPKKSKRPLASGEVTLTSAFIIFIILFAVSIIISLKLTSGFFYILVTYFLINIAYCFKLKNFSLIDVTIIAFGFVLRVFAGGAITGVVISKWLIVMTFLLALVLAFAKRRDDVLLLEKNGLEMRKSITGYNLEFINAAIVFITGVTLVSYIMYTISEEVTSRIGNNHIYLSSGFVTLGLLRYLQLTFVDQKSASPTKILLKDRFTQLNLILWILFFFVTIYGQNVW